MKKLIVPAVIVAAGMLSLAACGSAKASAAAPAITHTVTAPAAAIPYTALSQTPTVAPVATTAAPQGVTFVVTGPAEHVTVSEGTTNNIGEPNSPLNLTVPVNYGFYMVSVTTGVGGGTVTVKILVNGKVIGQGEASGSAQYSVVSIDNSAERGSRGNDLTNRARPVSPQRV